MATKKRNDVEWKEKLKEIQSQMPSNKIRIREDIEESKPFQSLKENLPHKAKHDYEKQLQPKPVKEDDKNRLVEIEVPHKVAASFDVGKSEEEIEVDDPAHVLVQQVRNGEIPKDELSVDQKFLIVKYLTEEKFYSIDEIADELKVTRPTVARYRKKLKEHHAKQLADHDAWMLGGEVYNLCLRAAHQALASGKPKQVADVLSSMISTLQSMGLVYKMPAQSQIQQAIQSHSKHDVTVSNIEKFKKEVEGNEINLENVLNELFDAAEKHEQDTGKNNNKG